MVSSLVRVKALALEIDLADEMNNGSKFHIIFQLHQPIGSEGAQFQNLLALCNPELIMKERTKRFA